MSSDPQPDLTTVYVGISNSDNKLTQIEWAGFIEQIRYVSARFASLFLGEWFSLADKPWQNAEFAWTMHTSELDELRADLATARDTYLQDSIALALVARTEFI